MKIVFLGTGGGRVVTTLQMRGTGGFVINTESYQIHVDPGPGAIINARRFGKDPQKTNVICLSHNHIDHVNDVWVMAEAVREAILISNKSCLESPEGIVTPYIKKMFSEVHEAEPNKVIELNDLRIRVTKAEHNGDTTGFIFESKYKLGYTSDTNYSKEIAKQYNGVDALIVNVLRPGSDRWKGHLCSEDVINFINDLEKKPKLVLLIHFGYKMLKANPIHEAREISKKTGVLCMAMTDGKRVDLKSELSQTRLF